MKSFFQQILELPPGCSVAPADDNVSPESEEVYRLLEDAGKGFNPDWSLPEATAESLREHMALAKAAQESEQQFRATVAAALRELRDMWQRRKNSAEDKVMESTLRDVLDELDATIAKLGLEEQ